MSETGKSLYIVGKSLGSAVWILTNKRGAKSEDAIKRRFDTVITSNSATELAYHLRGMIQLLKSESISLDYPRLAEDLFRFQSPVSRDSVRLQWGQDYFFTRGKEEESDEE